MSQKERINWEQENNINFNQIDNTLGFSIHVNTVRIRKTGTFQIPGLAQVCLPTSSNQKNATILRNSDVKSSFLAGSGGF